MNTYYSTYTRIKVIGFVLKISLIKKYYCHYISMGRWEARLTKSGNSTVVAIPPAILAEYGLKAGDDVIITDRPEGNITIKRPEQK